MALPAPRSLTDVRREVAVGCNLGAQPQRTKQYQPVIDRLIRECHAYLCRLTEWDIAANRMVEIPLVNGVNTYDFPDDCPPAYIDTMVVVNATTGEEQEMESGMRANERNTAKNANGQPLRWELLNGSMVIYPSPDTASWNKIRIYYHVKEVALNDDEDLIACDFDLLVKYAVRKVRASLGMPMLESDQEMQDYIDSAVASQGDGEIFHFGGKKSIKLEDRRHNRISRGLSQPNGADWQPPGF